MDLCIIRTITSYTFVVQGWFLQVPDQQEIDFLRLICVKNINDDYCYVALDNVIDDKSAPDFDVCMTYNCIIHYLCNVCSDVIIP